MRGVALSDTHLGHRRYPSTTDGRNSREVDVEQALGRALENTIEAGPDLVTVAGDVVDHPRVSVHAIVAWREFVRRIVDETSAHVVVVQGNHDAARTSSSQSPIVVPEDYDRVHIATTPQRIRFTAASTGESVAVAAFPFVALEEAAAYKVDPDPEADVNVLCIHAPLSGGGLPTFYAGEDALQVIDVAEDFDVLAAGDFHTFTRLHPDRLAFYSGAIERTSSNIWDETEPKGVVVYDTVAEQLVFVKHETRPVYTWTAPFGVQDEDLPALGRGLAGLNAILGDMAADEKLEDAIVRLKVEDFPRGRRNEIDWETVRELKSVCLHFALDLRWSDRDLASIHDRRTGERRTLTDDARDFFDEDEAGVQALAFDYLGIQTEGGAEPDNNTQDSAPDPGQSDVLYYCANCGNRDTHAPGYEPPCSGGCGASMVEGSPPERQIAAGGAT